MSGLTSLVVDRALDSDGGTDDVLTITGIATSVTVGAKGAVAAASRADINFEFSSVTGLTDSASATLEAASVSDLVFDDIETLSITVNTGTTTIEDTLDAEEATTITLTGAGNLIIGEVDAESAAADSTNFDAATAYTLNASAMTGALTLVGTEDSASVTVTAGSGDDKIYVSTSFDSGYTLKGGNGRDSIRIADGGDLTLLTGANVTDFEVLELNDGTGTYDLDFLAGIEAIQLTDFDAAAAITVDEIAEGVGATIAITAAAGTTFSQKGDADAGSVSDTFTVTIGGTAAVDAADLIISDIETVNIVSNGVAQNVLEVLEASAATTINFSGSQSLKVTAATNSTAARSIDASGMTGAFGIEMTAAAGSTGADLYKGSAGKDKIFTSEGADVVIGGGGADLIVALDAANDAYVFKYLAATESAGSGADVIDLTNGATITEGEHFTIDLAAFGFTGNGILGIKSHTTTAEAATDEVTNFASADVTDFFSDSGTDRRVAIEFDTDAAAISVTNGSGAQTVQAAGGKAMAVYVDVDGNGDYEFATDMKIILVGADLNGIDAVADYVFA